jgi:hypothetical protein
VIAGYTTEAADAVAIDLVKRFTRGFTTTHIQKNLATLDVTTFTNQDVADALFGQLLKRIGGYGYVDYHKDVHLFVGDEPNLPNSRPLTADHPTLGVNPTSSMDLSQMITRVFVEGGGSNALADIGPGEVLLPVENAVWYPEGGGVVTTSPQRLPYTGVDPGNDGTLVGPGASPSAAPAVSTTLGGAVNAGTHAYAVAFHTASGDSLVGPSANVTVGPVPGPTFGPSATAVAGGAMAPGFYGWAVTFVSPAGETVPGPIGPVVQIGAPPAPSLELLSVNYPGGVYTAHRTLCFAYSFIYSDGTESDISNASNTIFTDGVHSWQIDGVVTGPANVTGRRIYQWIQESDGGTFPPATYIRHVDLTDNVTQNVRSDAVKFPIYFFNPGAHNPISPITHLNQASVR